MRMWLGLSALEAEPGKPGGFLPFLSPPPPQAPLPAPPPHWLSEQDGSAAGPTQDFTSSRSRTGLMEFHGAEMLIGPAGSSVQPWCAPFRPRGQGPTHTGFQKAENKSQQLARNKSALKLPVTCSHQPPGCSGPEFMASPPRAHSPINFPSRQQRLKTPLVMD